MRVKTLWLALILLPVLAIWTSPGAQEGQEVPEMKPVLIVVDVQNIWLPRMAEEDRKSAPQKINDVIALFREFNHPVIRVYHSDPRRGPKPDTEPFEFPETIAVTDDDVRIVKDHPSSFTKTELDQVLKEGDRNTLFLCGLSATGCVLATYFGALDRDYMVFLVEDALLSHNASYTSSVEEIFHSMTIDEIRERLEGSTD